MTGRSTVDRCTTGPLWSPVRSCLYSGAGVGCLLDARSAFALSIRAATESDVSRLAVQERSRMLLLPTIDHHGRTRTRRAGTPRPA